MRVGALDQGCPDLAPFDAILVSGAVEQRPDTLLGQLRPGGRLACLRGGGHGGRGVLFVKSGEAIGERILFDSSGPALPEFKREPAFHF